jgi:periplasmic protein TonB
VAFEAYLEQTVARPRRGGRIIYTLSIAAHATAILGAVAYSFWHVEELQPPTVTVTFVSAAALPPPPPPPPPLGGGAGAIRNKTVSHPKIEIPTKVPELVQPKVDPPHEVPQESPKETPKVEVKAENAGNAAGAGDADGIKGGVAGGVKAGVVGGVVGGTGKALVAAPTAPKFLPPQIGRQQKLSGADPEFSTILARAGANYLVMAKICVATSGAVESVTLLKRAHPTLDANVLTTVKTWRFRPLMANGNPVPFCYFANFEFKSE